jgi:hypothetical protein
MRFCLRRINILEPISTAVLICDGFIARRPGGREHRISPHELSPGLIRSRF